MVLTQSQGVSLTFLTDRSTFVSQNIIFPSVAVETKKEHSFPKTPSATLHTSNGLTGELRRKALVWRKPLLVLLLYTLINCPDLVTSTPFNQWISVIMAVWENSTADKCLCFTIGTVECSFPSSCFASFVRPSLSASLEISHKITYTRIYTLVNLVYGCLFASVHNRVFRGCTSSVSYLTIVASSYYLIRINWIVFKAGNLKRRFKYVFWVNWIFEVPD